MPVPDAFAIPFIVHLDRLAVDSTVTFLVSALIAITVNAEAQAFAATLLGDSRSDPKDRFHFNAFLHLDGIGGLCFLLGGFGWPRRIDLDASRFRHPRSYAVLARFAGPLANFLMANIAASISWLFTAMSSDPRVFRMLMGVNLMVMMANLIPLPPMALGEALSILTLREGAGLRAKLTRIGPLAIVALVAADRFISFDLLPSLLTPAVRFLANLIEI